ncbi:LOW QUALITY PROTEIN: hypothetical protein V1477_021242 [Vespula maculifrons]|uniref:Uncharacterized protein n=1 Tax=Vespula maculifrons TaxID=7453 RepID=A0ABD2AGK6_VESMC
MQLFRSCYHRSIVYDHVHLPRGPYRSTRCCCNGSCLVYSRGLPPPDKQPTTLHTLVRILFASFRHTPRWNGARLSSRARTYNSALVVPFRHHPLVTLSLSSPPKKIGPGTNALFHWPISSTNRKPRYSLGSRCTRLYWEPPLVSPTERLSNGRPDRAARSSPSVAEFSEERRERRKINQASRPPSPSYKSGKTTKSVKG